jgi:protocatechuate 3,4-dioxygenase beta subunit
VEVELGEGPAPEIKIVVDDVGRVEGTVADEDGRPVRGAKVSLIEVKDDEMPSWLALMGAQRGTATTGEDGSFVIASVSPGEYRFHISEQTHMTSLMAPGQAPDEPFPVRVTVKAGEVARARVVVERSNGEIRGRVIDDIGEPVTDAFLEIVKEAARDASWMLFEMMGGTSGVEQVFTDTEGNFAIGGLGKGKYKIRAHRKGGVQAFVEHVPLGANVTIKLPRSGSISGTVAAQGGAPVKSFSIMANDHKNDSMRVESFTAADGAWTLNDLTPGEYRIRVEAPEGTASVEVKLSPGEQKTGVMLSLPGRGSARGRVVSLDDGSPVAGIRVLARSGSSHGGMATTATDGAFLLEDVPVGLISLFVTGMEYEHASIPQIAELKPGMVTELGEILVVRSRRGDAGAPGDFGFVTRGSDYSDDGEGPTSLAVSMVVPGKPAALAGLRVGDEIVSVDGYDVSGKRSYLFAALTRVPAGTTVSFGLARGITLSLTSVADD